MGQGRWPRRVLAVVSGGHRLGHGELTAPPDPPKDSDAHAANKADPGVLRTHVRYPATGSDGTATSRRLSAEAEPGHP